LRKPVVGRRIERAAQKNWNQQVMNRFILRQIRVQPHFISRLESRDLRDGQCFSPAGNFYFNTRTGQVERCGSRGGQKGSTQEQSKQSRKAASKPESPCHAYILENGRRSFTHRPRKKL